MVLLDAVRGPALAFNLARLQEADPARTIVIIGSSKTRCAIEADSIFNARLRQIGSNLRIVRLTKDLVAADDLPKVFAATIRLKPRLVLLEADLMIYEPRMFRGSLSPHADWRQSVRATGQSVLGLTGQDSTTNDNRATPPARGCNYAGSKVVDPKSLTALRMRNLNDRSASSPADRAPYVAFLHALRANGTDIALLRFPTRPDFIGQLPQHLVRDANAVAAALRRDEGLGEVRIAAPVRVADYQDAGHLGPDARRRVSAWLAAYLATRRGGGTGA